ncbi:D-alanyl carrier protein [Clostridium botulinum A2B3 87]|uniref:acyl carrier protein n=1 Tax=Clostridium botulinum TaxID=1491 RepID=UPI0004A58D79|nr:acyl carrier protein [Clostridium botulinum]KEI98775.1 D-alanyl carrier protein [Clostridium botulinum A2B3 87]MBN3346605.1 D-alanyl carrier protein [Clostridium botulinum]
MANLDRIKKFVSKYHRVGELGDDDNIFENGAVNSLFAMQLIVFLENEFNIKVENDDLDIKNFSTINSIVNFINSKLK